jgi:hypothetical protein
MRRCSCHGTAAVQCCSPGELAVADQQVPAPALGMPHMRVKVLSVPLLRPWMPLLVIWRSTSAHTAGSHRPGAAAAAAAAETEVQHHAASSRQDEICSAGDKMTRLPVLPDNVTWWLALPAAGGPGQFCRCCTQLASSVCNRTPCSSWLLC